MAILGFIGFFGLAMSTAFFEPLGKRGVAARRWALIIGSAGMFAMIALM